MSRVIKSRAPFSKFKSTLIIHLHCKMSVNFDIFFSVDSSESPQRTRVCMLESAADLTMFKNSAGGVGGGLSNGPLKSPLTESADGVYGGLSRVRPFKKHSAQPCADRSR